MKYGYKYLIYFLFFSISGHSDIPEDVSTNIKDQSKKIIKIIEENQPVEAELIINNFVNALFNNYISLITKNTQKKEIYEYVKQIINNAQRSKPLIHKIDIDYAQLQKDPSYKKLLNTREPFREVLEKFYSPFRHRIIIEFKNIEIPLELESVNSDGSFQLALEGISAVDVSKPGQCLVLKINPSEMHISHIRSSDVACPIPSERSGTFLVDFSEYLANLFKIKRITLDDQSKIICSKNLSRASLAFLKQMKEGESWYEKLGYTPILHYEHYREAVKKLRELPLEEILNELARVNLKINNEKEKEHLISKRRDLYKNWSAEPESIRELKKLGFESATTYFDAFFILLSQEKISLSQKSINLGAIVKTSYRLT